MYYEDENKRFSTFYENADVVLQGIPVEEETDEENYSRTYTVSVEKVWKGQADAYINIDTHLHSATCGIRLNIDERTIIFAYEGENGLETGLCSGTTAANDEQMLAWLNQDNSQSSSSSGNSSESSSSTEADCTPYYCADGNVFDACTEDGAVINYLVAPCQFSGGEGSSSQSSEVGNDFADVPDSYPNFTAITYVREEGIVEGYDDNTYRPEQFINRAEFTKIIIASVFDAEGIDECETDDLFSDISQSDWYADYVCMAKQADVIGGYPDGTFKPSNYVNFAEAAKIIVVSFDIDTEPADHLGAWWKPYVFGLARIGGLPSTFSDPNQQLTRGDMAEMIYRVKMGLHN